MRVHCLKADPDFWCNTFAAIPATILDGEWINNVVMADDEKGLVEVIKLDAHNRPVLCDGEVMTKTLRGSVQIVGRLLGEHVN